MNLTNKTWHLLVSKGDGVNNSRNVFVLKQHALKWDSLKANHTGNYYLTTILRTIVSLNALAGGRSGLAKKMTIDGAQITYQIDNDGDILIHGLVIDEQYVQPGKQTTGAYPVRFNKNLWETKDRPIVAMDLTHRWNNAHYAAVSGVFENKETAGKELVTHIEKAYKAAIDPREIQKTYNHYTLYWQNKKHSSDQQRDHLVSLIQQAQEQKASVNWLVHGEGVGTFVRAMKVLESYPSLSRFEAQDEEIVRNLHMSMSSQKVFFSNPRGQGTSQAELEKLSKKIGFSYVDTHVNAYDMWNEDSRKHVGKKAAELGAKVTVGGVGALGTSHAVKTWDLATSAGNTAMTAGLLFAGYIVARSSLSTLSGYARSLPSAWQNTLGKGNQNWA